MKKSLLGDLFLTFLKIGAFTFGGGYGMIALISKETVDKHQWMSNQEFLDLIAIAESTPGPIAVNSATYVGYKTQGFWGAFFATLGVVLPSFVIILVISLFIEPFRSLTIVGYAFRGIQAGVAVLIINAALKLAKSLKKNWFEIALIVLAFVVMMIDIVPTPLVILTGGAIGFLHHLISRKKGADPV